MTIPTLSAKIQQNKVSAALPKMYSTLRNAAKMYQADNGVDIGDFDTTLSAREFLDTYFKPYLSGATSCTGVSDCYKGNKKPVCLNGKSVLEVSEGLILSNGSILSIANNLGGTARYNSFSKVIQVDVDGAKGDNRSGHDIFYFFLVNSKVNEDQAGGAGRPGFFIGGIGNSFKPFSDYSMEQLLDNSNAAIHRPCHKSTCGGAHGDACAAVLSKNGWKFPNNYPW